MNNPIKIILILLFSWLCYSLSAQQDCKVLDPEIAGKYMGKCKDGLAHGKGKADGIDSYTGQFSKGLPDGMGTYTWSNGDSYTGEWEQGYRQGEGTFKFKSNGKDTTLTGLWEKDNYAGPKPPKPRIINSLNVDRYTFVKSGKIPNRVLINLFQNGVRNISVENFMIVASSGNVTNIGQSAGFENITFPVTVKVNYSTLNKAHMQRFYVVFEFEIYEPGAWDVTIHN
jgi:hypothetical protein